MGPVVENILGIESLQIRNVSLDGKGEEFKIQIVPEKGIIPLNGLKDLARPLGFLFLYWKRINNEKKLT
jgi:hypothetical protein